MHYFVVAGLAALGAGVKLAILDAGGDHHYDDTAWILCAGLALTMAGLAAIQLAVGPMCFDTDVALRLRHAAFALLVLPFDFAPLTVVILIAAVLVLQVAYELARHEDTTSA